MDTCSYCQRIPVFQLHGRLLCRTCMGALMSFSLSLSERLPGMIQHDSIELFPKKGIKYHPPTTERGREGAG